MFFSETTGDPTLKAPEIQPAVAGVPESGDKQFKKASLFPFPVFSLLMGMVMAAKEWFKV